MTRFQKLAAATVATTVLLVTIGVVVRATDSGMGCPDWPLCHNGVLPPLDDTQAWLEWIHRTVAAIIGFEILGLALLAWLDHRDRRSILWPTLAAVVLVGFQAWLGRETVRLNNSGESVTAHLATAMALLGLLVFVFVRSFYPARVLGRGASQRFTLLAAFTAAAIYALLLFGSHVTATSQWFVFPDWPLMNGALLPPLTDANSAHVLHRWVAAVVGVIVWATALAAWRTQRSHPWVIRLALTTAVLFTVQAVVGGLQVLTGLAAWTQTLHLALGAVIWALSASLVVVAYFEARTTVTASSGVPAAPGRTGDDATTATAGRAHEGRHRPRLHRADEAPDHRAAARDDDPGDGHGDPRDPRHAARGVVPARVLDADLRHARGGLGQRDQPVPRPRHRPPDDAHPTPARCRPTRSPRRTPWCSGSCWAWSRSC